MPIHKLLDQKHLKLTNQIGILKRKSKRVKVMIKMIILKGNNLNIQMSNHNNNMSMLL